jgi:cell division protease FtsH
MNMITSGAENDLKEAQKLVRKMILDWGMGDKFKNISFGSQRQQVFLGEEIAHRRDYSDATNKAIDEEIIRILTASYEKAYNLLKEHDDEMDKIADELLHHEEIERDVIKRILDTKKE